MVIYELAHTLRMPVYSLLDSMTYEELGGWLNYFERRPEGWREDDRAFKLLQAQGVKAKAWDVFQSLKAIYKGPEVEEGKFSVQNLKSSDMFQRMMKAKGGENIWGSK